jgi:hypothetical protein
MPSEMTRPCIFVVLGNELTLAKELRWPLQEVTVGDAIYQDAGFGNWTAFYDWLRTSDGTLLGVRYWLRDDLVFLEKTTKELGYVKSDPGRHLEFTFWIGEMSTLNGLAIRSSYTMLCFDPPPTEHTQSGSGWKD